MKRGEFFPPFLYISVINSCNLRCQGCWVDVAAKQQTIDLPAMNKHDLFKTVILDGALPRKTFSMGEAYEKRFYMECRSIS